MKRIKPITYTALLVALISGIATAGDFDWSKVEVTRDPTAATYKGPAECRSSYNYDMPFRMKEEYISSIKSSSKLMIYVNATLYPDINSKVVNEYIPELEEAGWEVVVNSVSGGDEVSLKNELIAEYDANGYFYTLLIGDLPVPWYYIEDDFGEYGPATFPIDLYYMDLNGVWEDDDSDGVYDGHSGDEEPEIPVARWTVSPLTFGGNTEKSLIENYIDKNLAYRNGTMVHSEAGLAYIDDDWSHYYNWGEAVDDAFPGTEIITDEHDTNAADYENNRLPTAYEHILVCVHSGPNTHYFYVDGSYSTVTSAELYSIKSSSISYNLFACSNSRYTENDYMGGWYCFMDNEWGLVSLGCTKTGSMLEFEDYYECLDDGDTYGEAFRQWFEDNGETGAGSDSRSWFYGMSMNGDPTLRTSMFIDVTVFNLTANAKRSGINLVWEYRDDGENVGFNLYRTELNTEAKSNKASKFAVSPEVKLNTDLIKGGSPLQYFDSTVNSDTKYEYRLEMVVSGNPGKSCLATALSNPTVPVEFGIGKVYPNPVVDNVTIEYTLPNATSGELDIFDISGRKVYSKTIENGTNSVNWDTASATISGGVYLVRLSSGNEKSVKKLVIVK